MQISLHQFFDIGRHGYIFIFIFSELLKISKNFHIFQSGTGNTSLHSIRQNITAGSRQNKNNFNPNLQAIPMKNIVTLPDPIFNQCENRTHFHPKKSKSRNNKCDDEHSHFTSACSTSFGNLCDLGGIEDLGGNNKSVVVVIRNEGESEIL